MQIVIVIILIALAAWFVGRRLVKRAASFRASAPTPGCSCGCGDDRAKPPDDRTFPVVSSKPTDQ